MTRTPFALTLAALALALAACQPIEEEEDDSDLDPQLQGCRPIEGEVDVSDIPAGCVGCEILQPENAVDGNPASFATLRMPAEQGGTLKIQVLNGPESPATYLFGVLQSIEYGESASASISIGTLAGTTATADQKSLSLGDIVGGDEDAPARFSFKSTVDFDGMEVGFTRTGGINSSGIVTARIHEFCSNQPPAD